MNTVCAAIVRGEPRLLLTESVLRRCYVNELIPCMMDVISRAWLRSAWFDVAVVGLEAAVSSAIVLRVPYTEIDWIAYMQEVEGWSEAGDTNYSNLKGDTGPLVYPAGFLYIFRVLRWITEGGRGPAAIRIAQWLFVLVYVATQGVVLAMYRKARLSSPTVVLFLILSKRLHSLYMLRLFNDCFAMLAVYVAVLLCMNRKWLSGTLVLSVAASIKMNALLFLPGLVFLLVRNVGLARGALYLFAAVALQAAIGAPFLLTHPGPYLSKAFELSRVFFHTWTVNWKFLPEDVFVSPRVATGLLAGQLGTLLVLGAYRWCEHDGGLLRVLTRTPSGMFRDAPAFIAYVLCVSNFAGIAFARTLHYQFYTWYFHTLPLLYTVAGLPLPVMAALSCGIEYAFNVGDASGAGSPLSSAVLQACHFLLLGALLAAKPPSPGAGADNVVSAAKGKQA